MGNGLRFRINRNDGQKPKTRKGNQIMKNRNIQFKPTAGVLIPLLLACLAAVFISAPIPAAAGEMVPFNATLSGYVETSEFLPPCTIHGHAIVFGNATHLGVLHRDRRIVPRRLQWYARISLHWLLSLVCGQPRRNLRHFRRGTLTPTGTPGVFDNHETADATGGTGRFAGATGHWEAGGQIDFTTEPISFVTPAQGWINFHRH